MGNNDVDKPNCNTAPKYDDFISSISRLESRKRIVSLDHDYQHVALINADKPASTPCRLLLGIPPSTSVSDQCNKDCDVDVENVDVTDDDVISGGADSQNSSMFDCQKFVQDARDLPDNCVEQVDLSVLSPEQRGLWREVMSSLRNYHLARLALAGQGERRAAAVRCHADCCADRVATALTAVDWQPSLCRWLHAQLVQKLDRSLLALYLDSLQTLWCRVPSLVERLISGGCVRHGVLSTDSLLAFFRRGPWIPASQAVSQHKLSFELSVKMSGVCPVVVWIPPFRQQQQQQQNKIGGHYQSAQSPGRRLLLFRRKLAQIGKVITVNMTEVCGGVNWLKQCIQHIRCTLADIRRAHSSSRPVFLAGWRTAALLVLHVALLEPLSGCVCLAPPLRYASGHRLCAGDPLRRITAPTLFVLGQRATDVSCELVDSWRSQMTATSRLTVMASSNCRLQVQQHRKLHRGLSQYVYDLTILNEVSSFIADVINLQGEGAIATLVPPPSTSQLLADEDSVKNLSRKFARKLKSAKPAANNNNTQKTDNTPAGAHKRAVKRKLPSLNITEPAATNRNKPAQTDHVTSPATGSVVTAVSRDQSPIQTASVVTTHNSGTSVSMSRVAAPCYPTTTSTITTTPITTSTITGSRAGRALKVITTAGPARAAVPTRRAHPLKVVSSGGRGQPAVMRDLNAPGLFSTLSTRECDRALLARSASSSSSSVALTPVGSRAATRVVTYVPATSLSSLQTP